MGRGRILLALPLVWSVACVWAREGGYHRPGDGSDGGDSTVSDEGGAPPVEDAAPPAPVDAEAGPVDDGIPKRYVFVSTDAIEGYHPSGLAHFDGVCNSIALASDVVRGRKFKAWLSSKSEGAAKHVQAEGFTGKYILTNGEVAFKSAADLTHDILAKPINVDAFGGGPITEPDIVWTGTNADGTLANPDCADWTAMGPTKGWTGKVSGGTGGEWTHAAQTSCSETALLYCFEVP